MPAKRNDVSRRQFLQGVAVAAASFTGLNACGGEDDAVTQATPEGGGATPTGTTAATTPAATATETAAAAGGEPFTLGLMVPLSGTYASLGRDMQQGFQLYLDQHDGMLGGREVEVVSAETEANPEAGLRVARRLIEEDQVAVATGIVSSAVALGVKDVFGEAGTPLIITNAGANMVNREPTLPNLFRTSFTNRQPNFALGQWAATEFEGLAVAGIAPDYAAGQEHLQGFVDGFGSDVVVRLFPPFGTTSDYQPFLTEIQQSGAEAVFAFFAGGEAITFVQQYTDFGLVDSLPLIGPGFLTDDGILEQQGAAAMGIRTALHYSPLLDNETNKAFDGAYRDAHDSPATTYAMQSYDAAQLIDMALTDNDVDTSDAAAFSEALASVQTIPSPRGEFSLEAEVHDPIQPIYLREVQEVEGGMGNVVIEDLGEFPPLPEA